jgi:hypothetical protein
MSFIIGVKLVCNVNTTHIMIVVIINAGISVRTTHSPFQKKLFASFIHIRTFETRPFPSPSCFQKSFTADIQHTPNK